MNRLENKIVIVTGGASGIGRAIAEGMANEGAKVCIADIAQEKCNQAAAEIGQGAIGLALDVTNQASIDSVVSTVVETFGGVNILVNSAGVFGMQPFTEITEADFDRIVGVNTRGLLFMTQAVARAMLAGNHKGSIVNITSSAGRRASPAAAVYSLSKAAVISITQCAAQEFAQSEIRVNAIAPGTTETPMWEGVRKAFIEVHGANPDETIAAATPAGRLAEPADYVGAAIYLASDEASFVFGQTLNVDGGYQLN